MIGPADLALLPALDALLTEENVTRAALRLGISQAALSVKLKRLRDITGDALLVPSGKGRGMVPTPRALALRAQVREAMAVAETALSGAASFNPATSRATLRIVANDNAASLISAVLIARISSSHARGVRLALLRPDGTRLADRLENGEADIAIAADGSLLGGDNLISQTVFRDTYVTAQRRGHPRGSHPFDLNEFCSMDHLIVSDNGAFEGMVDRILGTIGKRRRVVLSIHSYLLAPMIVARSDLLVTLPGKLLEQHSTTLELFEAPLLLPAVSLKAFWHPRTQDDPVNRWARDCIFSTSSIKQSQLL